MTILRDLLRQRSEDGQRTLVVQGGGMRGVYSMGALSQLAAEGFQDAFDVIIGSSAGAINSAYFLSGQAESGVKLYIDDLSSRRFLNLARLQKIIDIDYLIDHLLKERLPLDVMALRDSGTLLQVVLTDAATTEARVITNRDPGVDFYEVMRATAALPVFYNRQVPVGDRCYVDGSLADNFPILRAVEGGATFLLAIATRVAGYRKCDTAPFYRLVSRIMSHGQSPAVKGLIGRADQLYNDGLDLLESKSENQAFVGCAVYPSKGEMLVSRTESRKERLRSCVEMGRRDMCAALAKDIPSPPCLCTRFRD